MINKNIIEAENEQEYIILAAIADVKLELNQLRAIGNKEKELECFKRLINLFSTLNIENLLKEKNKLI